MIRFGRQMSIAQLARFGAIGGLCLLASTAALAALRDLAGLYYLVAFAISFCLGHVMGYLLNGRYTFSVRASRAGVSRYLLLNGLFLAVNSLLLKLLVDGAHMWYIGASLLLAAGNAPVSFLVHRAYSYGVRESVPAQNNETLLAP